MGDHFPCLHYILARGTREKKLGELEIFVTAEGLVRSETARHSKNIHDTFKAWETKEPCSWLHSRYVLTVSRSWSLSSFPCSGIGSVCVSSAGQFIHLHCPFVLLACRRSWTACHKSGTSRERDNQNDIKYPRSHGSYPGRQSTLQPSQ